MADVAERARDEADEAARRASDSLRRLFEANVVGILISNNAGAILEANDAFLDTIGYSREDLERGLIDWRSLTPPEWLHLDERAIEDLAARGNFAQYEKEYFRKDGTRVPISLGGARLAETPDQQICYVVDLSEIRRTEAALRRSESRFRQLADANVIGIITSRISDNTIVEANDEFLRMIGYTRPQFEAARIRWKDITPPEWHELADRAMQTLRETGRFMPIEKEYVRRDGSRVPVLVGGALLEGSEDDEMIRYVLDLSDQRAASRRIAESEQRYRVLAEAMPQIVMMADEARHMVYVNRRYEDYTGIPADQADRWPEAIHPDDLPRVLSARASGQPYEIEYRLRRAADGAYRWHYARALRVSDDGGPSGWLATAIDIDDRKRAEDALRFLETAGARLSQSLDLRTTFETLLDLVVPAIGDWATINLRDEEGRVKTVLVRHFDPEKALLARELSGTYLMNERHTKGSAGVFATGKANLLSHATLDDIRDAANPQYFPIVAQFGYGSLVALPIFSGEDVVGSIGIVSAGDRRIYTEADLPPLEELARRAGFAIRNARAYEREHRVADMLQEAALPRKLPVVDGFRFDGYYQAGRQEALIGGDWYDALVVADGRIVISVGDVAGSGLKAAVLMGNVRQIIRGAAYIYADPMMMLEVADRILRTEHEDSMVTAFVGVIEPARRTMLYASAGHLPALLRTADGRVSELSAPGPPLGFRTMATSESRSAVLPPRSCLLLYTDGLVEWSRNLLAGEELLRSRFAETGAAGGERSVRALIESILPPTGAADDVAALAVTID